MSLDAVDRLLTKARLHRSGLVVGVRAADGARTWHRGDLPAGADSVFEIGSVTKTFTALLLADLVRDGTVTLDDPVASYLPVAPAVVGRPITLADLATHHSGLPRLPAGTALRGTTVERHDPYARFDEAEMVRAITATAPGRPPGEKFTYSNFGAGLLGWALARRCGTTYAGLVADRITRPLGLADTWIELPESERHRLAPGHGWWGGDAGPWDLALLAGAGGLRSTATDLLRYLAVFAEAASGPLAEAAALTRKPRHDLGAMKVAMGWIVLPGGTGGRKVRQPHDLLMHDGGTGGYRSFVGVVPETGTAVVVLSSQARGVTGLGLQLVRAATG